MGTSSFWMRTRPKGMRLRLLGQAKDVYTDLALVVFLYSMNETEPRTGV